MSNDTTHLPDSALVALIQGNDFAADGDEARIHFDNCSRCQARMEDLAADRQWWTECKPIVESSVRLLDKAPSAELRIPDFQHMLERPTHPEMFGRLDQYEVESAIGSGGMGVVFKGFDTELHRVVAIKMLLPHLSTHAAARKRFLREARSAAGISHEHIVEIYQVRSDTRYPYLVMAYVPGLSLQKTVEKQGPLSGLEIVRFGMQIAKGLAAAHESGVVHRDIKPANVLLRDDGNRVLIGDFGLARTIDDASLSCTGIVSGTPHYMSPEQCNGRRTGAASDLFSLGCLFYFMATGTPPFSGDSVMAVMNKICTTKPVPLHEIRREVPETLSMIVQKLLAKKELDRFGSATELVDVLRELQAHLQQPDIFGPPKICSSHVKNRKRVRVCIAIMFLLTGIASLSLLFYNTWKNNPDSESIALNTPATRLESNVAGNSRQLDQLIEEFRQNLRMAEDRDEFRKLVADFENGLEELGGFAPVDSLTRNETFEVTEMMLNAPHQVIELYQRELEMLEEFLGPEHGIVGQLHASIGRVHIQTGDWAKAKQSYSKSISILEKTTAGSNAELIRLKLWRIRTRLAIRDCSGEHEFDEICKTVSSGTYAKDIHYHIRVMRELFLAVRDLKSAEEAGVDVIKPSSSGF